MREKKVLTAEIQNRYSKASKKAKSGILDEFTTNTGYNRRILWLKTGKVIGYASMGGKKIKYIIGKRKKKKYRKPRIYNHDVFLALRKIWVVYLFYYLCIATNVYWFYLVIFSKKLKIL